MSSAHRPALSCRLLILASLLAALPACMEGPENGDPSYLSTLGSGFNFNGKHNKPNIAIRIQVLSNPDNLSSWVTIGTAVSSSTPAYWNQAEPYYTWSVSAVPVPSAGLASRWPQGGILRFRAIDTDNLVLATFDQDRSECFINHGSEGWIAAGQACESDFPVAAVISATPTPTDLAATPPYLAFAAGVGSEAETDQYYDAINAPATLAAFKQEHGFGAIGSDEVSATYFNAGDLGAGREMHCKSFQKSGMSQPGRACYVSNYGDGAVNFGGNANLAVDRAVTGTQSGVHTGAFATVAMAYYPPISANNSVRFIVYDANDQRTNKAQLDTKGHNKGIPHNCITCHGGANYNASGNYVLGAGGVENGARFLPFDVAAFGFSSQAGFTLSAQQEKLRKLNEHILAAAPAQATVQLIQGWYAAGSIHTPGTVLDTSFTPATFAANGADRKVYKDVVAPYCRGCHASQSGSFTFTDSDDFKDLAFLIDYRVCVTGADPAFNHLMPNAEVTLKRFWQSPARAYLAGYLNSAGPCKP